MTILDFHRRSDVNLDADEAPKSAVDPVVVDHFAHDVAVQDMNHEIPTHYKVVFVPIVYLNERLEFFGRPKRGDDLRIGSRGDMNHVAAPCENGAATLLIILPGVDVLAVYVRLRTAQYPMAAVDFDAAIVDSTVAEIANTILGLKFKVFRLAAMPDDKTVVLEQIGRRYFANQFAVFGTPVCSISVPSIESLAVEDGRKAGVAIVEQKDLRHSPCRLKH